MQVFVGGGNAIFLLLTVLFTGFLGLVGFVAWRRKNRALTRTTTSVAAVVISVYAALLVTFAVLSKERVLAPGEIRWYCGFYLDCHLGVSIAKVESARNIPAANGQIVPHGIFRIVTVQFHNSAVNPDIDMTLYRPAVAVVDSRGERYHRDYRAENALARSAVAAPPLQDKISVGHEPRFATMVFDIPADANSPRLSLEEGFILDRLIELLLVNDDNSILHKRTYLALADSFRELEARSRIAQSRNRALR